MQKLKILNTREIKQIKDKLKKQFGYHGILDYAFLLNEKGRLFIVNRDISKIDLDKLKVDKYGLYFGELRNEELRLSMEGSWLVGQKAKKNVVELDKKEVKKYFLGENLDPSLKGEKRFILLKYLTDTIGCAKYNGREVLNFLPKTRRTKELIV